MYFEELIKGKKWLCIADGPKNPITGKRRQISRRGKTKAEAKLKVEAAIEEAKQQFSYDPNIKVADFSKIWFENYVLRGNKPNTNDYREFCLSLLNKQLGQVPIKLVTPVKYQTVLNTLFKKGIAFYTLRGVNNVAGMMFGYAKEVKLIKDEPTESAFIPKKKLEIEEIDGSNVSKLYLEPDELEEFLESVNKYRNIIIPPLLHLIAFTGMRPGEAISLLDSDIDLEKGLISITKTTYPTKKSKKGTFTLVPPKTKNGKRMIDVDPIIIEMIKEMLEQKKTLNYPESKFIFSTTDGHPPTVKYLRQTVYRIGLKTTIPKSLHTYMLRHTHISLLAEAGAELSYIMDRVGHKDSRTTTDIYLHVTKGMRENAMKKMHDKFSYLMKKR